MNLNAKPSTQAPPSGGAPLPRWLPVALAVTIFAGALVLYGALEARQNRDIIQAVRVAADGARNQLDVRMDSRFRSLARMARGWELSGPPAQSSGSPGQSAWQANAASYVHDVPDAQSLEWIDAAHRVRWIVPEDGGETKLDELTLEERRQAALDQAQRERRPVITRIVTLVNGGLGFVIYVPIIMDGKPDGFLAAVFKAETCLQRYLPAAVAQGEAISVSDGGQVFYGRDADGAPGRKDWVVPEKIGMQGATWDMRIWPTPALAARLDSPLPGVVLGAGALCALLLGAATFYAQRFSSQAAETARANAALREALEKVETLEGMLPMCCECKRVRDDAGYWSQVDTYIRKHTRASVSHSYCPECVVKFYEECGFDVPDKLKEQLAAGNFE